MAKVLPAALVLVGLLGCERADSRVDAPVLVGPEAPEVEAMRSTSTAHDPPPPRPALSPDLVGIPGREKRWFLALNREERHVVRQICRFRAKNPCFGIMPRPRDADPHEMLLAALRPDQVDGVNTFCVHANPRRGCNTPLVVAFDGQPIEYTRSADRFAFTPGEPVASDWPTPVTPWIALDRDGDGAITSGAELFGDATGDARNGFEALAQLDANHDGVIDRADPAFARLLLWADTNGDRRSSPDELRPLADVVVEIPLAHHIDARCVHGNCEGERGTFVWRAGDATRTGAVVDVYLRSL